MNADTLSTLDILAIRRAWAHDRVDILTEEAQRIESSIPHLRAEILRLQERINAGVAAGRKVDDLSANLTRARTELQQALSALPAAKAKADRAAVVADRAERRYHGARR